MTTRTLVRLLISGGLFLLFMLHVSGAVQWQLLERAESFTYDARVRLTLSHTTDPRVVVLDIDEKTLAAEGQLHQQRARLAEMVTLLFERYRIRALGFDITFPEPDNASGARLLERLAKGEMADLPGFAERAAQLQPQLDNDRIFADALRGRAVVMGYFFRPSVPEGERKTAGGLCPPALNAEQARLYAVDFIKAEGFGANIAPLAEAAPVCGFFDNPTQDGDGIYRRVPLLQMHEGAVYPSLALALTQLALGNPPIGLEFDPPDVRTSLNLERVTLGNLAIPVDGDVAIYVPYRGPFQTFTYVSATDVLRGTADGEVLADSIVLLGTSAAGLLDLRTTPIGVFAGVEVHANIVSGILDGLARQRAPYYSGIETVLLLLIALAVAFAFILLSPLGAALVGLGLTALVTALAFGLWSGALFIMPLGVPVLFILSLFLAHLLYGYFIESRGKREISKLFGQYVPPELVEEMAAHPEAISMEGESREMSVLFSDVRSFTSISEKLDAKELAAMMNAYLSKQTGVVQRNRGTIDKYIGDAIMAFWGAPLADKDHALNAVRAGMEMVKAVRELDEDFAKRGWPKLNIGVGINTGKMNVGNMGSEFRMAYTVMGDAVNLGARLEGLTKEYGVGLMISEYTRNQLPGDWAFRELDSVRVKGKNEPVSIYEPMGPKEALDPAVRTDLARHRGAMQLYRAQKWDQAEAEFFTLKTGAHPHPVYDLFLERILFLRENPPGKDWDGAFTFTHK